ncbi:MAG: electron transfer flavoprotein subunit beta/FixA family protein [Desulfobacula sp.]|nr:electron transfer flavoprotein subunit beta/FixA family protein [Desulfobacula sp.]
MGFNIIACIKSVAVTGQDQKDTRFQSYELNPFDRPAIEMALSLIKTYNGTLTVLSMGPESASYALYQAMSMGADRAVLICDPALKESDTYITSKVLGTALHKMSPFDLLFFGTRTSDSDTGHVGPQTAQMLNLPFVINIQSLEKNNNHLCVTRKADGYQESFDLPMPAGFTVHHNYKQPGFTKLHEIENTFNNKKIEIWNSKKLGLKNDEIGVSASPTKIISLNKKQDQKICKLIEGSLETKAQLLSKTLIESGLVG